MILRSPRNSVRGGSLSVSVDLEDSIVEWRLRGGKTCDMAVTLEFCGPSELMSPDVNPFDFAQLFSCHFNKENQLDLAFRV